MHVSEFCFFEVFFIEYYILIHNKNNTTCNGKNIMLLRMDNMRFYFKKCYYISS